MSPTPRSPTLSRRRRSVTGRIAAWLAARASGRDTALWLVIGFAALHAVLWTLILSNLKAAQDLHFDVAEAYAWGRHVMLGYGKHPPLSGWIAGLWFSVFPAADWAAYALAMTTVAAGLVLCWLIARRVVDDRRAFLVVVMLAVYPIFNFKGFKYNADLLQLVTLPLLVLAYLDAFRKRSVWSGLWLGLAAAAAMMTKYWVLTMIGAIGFAALLHPARMAFLRSPAPWVAIGVFALALVPHLVWLMQAHFAPLTYAGSTYSITDHAYVWRLVRGYIDHNIVLLLLPIALAALALAWWPQAWRTLLRDPRAFLRRPWTRRPVARIDLAQALNIWLIQAIVAIGPPIGALILTVYIKTDWGISLFFLVPLALLAIPVLQVPRRAAFYLCAMWLAGSFATLATAQHIALYDLRHNPNGAGAYALRSGLARELTEAWRSRFNSPWPVAVGFTEISTMMTFYSSDHPAPLVPGVSWEEGSTSFEDARRLGYIAICDTADPRLADCEKWMAESVKGERIDITTQRFFRGAAAPPVAFHVTIVAPAK